MKPFQFKKFSVRQSKNVFRVGTDGVLLGALSTVHKGGNILEVGTGTGLVSLMIAQRNPTAEILALDLNEDAAVLAEENFKNSSFRNRLKALHQDFKTFESDRRFDSIISNPPYFEENTSAKDVIARQQTELSFENLIRKSGSLLTSEGRLSVIIPFTSGDSFTAKCTENGFFASRKIKIFGIQNAAPKRLILEFTFKEQPCTTTEFMVEKSPRQYSDEYLRSTEDFHLFPAK